MFDGLLSNSRLKAELTAAIAANKPLQAYLFCGDTGSGKHTAARMLAAALVGGDRALRGAHADVLELLPEPGEKRVSVKQVRQMRADAFVSPIEGDRKVYIADVSLFGSEACQNALLTVLEQPPSFSYFILLSDRRGRVLSTVQSRCAVFEMEFVPIDVVEKYLLSNMPDLPERRAIIAAKLSGGNVGKAVELASGEPEKYVDRAERLISACAAGDTFTACAQISGMKKDEALCFLPVLAEQIDTALKERISVLQNGNASVRINMNTLYDAAVACERAAELISANVSAPLALESVVFKLGGK